MGCLMSAPRAAFLLRCSPHPSLLTLHPPKCTHTHSCPLPAVPEAPQEWNPPLFLLHPSLPAAQGMQDSQVSRVQSPQGQVCCTALPWLCPQGSDDAQRCQSHFTLFGNPPPSLLLHVGGTESGTNSQSWGQQLFRERKGGFLLLSSPLLLPVASFPCAVLVPEARKRWSCTAGGAGCEPSPAEHSQLPQEVPYQTQLITKPFIDGIF